MEKDKKKKWHVDGLQTECGIRFDDVDVLHTARAILSDNISGGLG